MMGSLMMYGLMLDGLMMDGSMMDDLMMDGSRPRGERQPRHCPPPQNKGGLLARIDLMGRLLSGEWGGRGRSRPGGRKGRRRRSGGTAIATTKTMTTRTSAGVAATSTLAPTAGQRTSMTAVMTPSRRLRPMIPSKWGKTP